MNHRKRHAGAACHATDTGLIPATSQDKTPVILQKTARFLPRTEIFSDCDRRTL